MCMYIYIYIEREREIEMSEQQSANIYSVRYSLFEIQNEKTNTQAAGPAEEGAEFELAAAAEALLDLLAPKDVRRESGWGS